MYLIIGLGNPGDKYRITRHNLGFMVLERLAKKWHKHFLARRKTYKILQKEFAGEEIILIKPETYMNQSGLAIQQLMKRYHFDKSRLLIVCDDFNLPLGKIRLRKKGSHGGHNGLASVIDFFGTNEFPRLRLGIGPPEQNDIVDFVLSSFKKNEWTVVNEMLDQAQDIIIDFVHKGINQSMNKHN